MRFLLVLLAARMLAAAPAPEEKDVVSAVQKLFDAMAAHDAAAIRAAFTPEAALVSTRADGTAARTTGEQFAVRLGASKDALLERMWEPKVLVRGGIAVVWAEYDFHRNKTFTHCGVDSVSLIRTAEGWKVSGLSYTVETSGCKPSPLGAVQ